MNPIILFGTGQLADIAHVLLTHDSPYEVVAFCVDRAYLQATEHRGLPVVATEEVAGLYPPATHRLFLPMSAKRMNRLREEKYQQFKAMGYAFISYISSHATVLPETRIGDNCFIFEHNVIQPFASIGNNVVLWSGNHIGHHSVVMDHTFITSHVVVSGNVTIESHCFLGVNATLRDGIRIADSTLVGAGATILKDTEPGSVYIGLPAKKLPQPSDQIDLS